MRRAFLLACLPALALAMGTPPQKPATTVAPQGRAATLLRDDDLRAEPDPDARSLLRLARGQKVRLLADRGGWSQLSAGGQTGWVRVLSVRAESDGAGLASIAQAASTPADPGRAVAVAGVRGLDEASLVGAAFNGAELAWLEQFAMGRDEAVQFAQAAGLVPRAMAYPAPPGGTVPAWRNEEP